MVKVRPTRVEELIREHRAGAGTVRKITADLDSYLSATQLGITLASLGLGWIGETAFSRLLAAVVGEAALAARPWLQALAPVAAFVAISFLHIVVGELAPKSLAIRRAESVALAVAYPMRLFYLLFFPFIWSLHALSRALLRAAGVWSSGHHDSHSEEEIKIILAQARSAGLLSAPRSEVLRKVLTLPTKTARHLMVPRNDVVFFDVNLPAEDNLARAMEARHTRFPLCDRELDEVLGVVDVRQYLFVSRQEGGVDLPAIAEPVPYFPEMMSAERLLAEFRQRHATMAVIVDEYGGASGIVTPSDVVRAVMGDLEDDDEAEVVPLPGGAYDVDGTVPLEEVEERLRVGLHARSVRTVAGFLMEHLGRMPRVGDRIQAAEHSFHILEVEGPRVRRVRIQKEQHTVRAAPAAKPGDRPSS